MVATRKRSKEWKLLFRLPIQRKETGSQATNLKWKHNLARQVQQQQQQPSLIPLSGVGYMDQMTP